MMPTMTQATQTGTFTLHRAAADYLLKQVEDGKWALNTQWVSNAPTPEQAETYRQQHGDDALRLWYLATDEAGQPALPAGDFNRVHRSGVVAAKRLAERAGAPDIVEAADEILDLFDRLNAC